MNDPQERSIEEWQNLRRANAVAEQEAASLTHELLREKAKTEQLKADLAAAQNSGKWAWTDVATIIFSMFCGIILGYIVGRF